MRPRVAASLILLGLVLGASILVHRRLAPDRRAPHGRHASEGTSAAANPEGREPAPPPAERERDVLDPEESAAHSRIRIMEDAEANAPGAHVFHGRVVDAATGLPLGASVEALTTYGGKPTRVRADRRGFFRLVLDAASAGALVRHEGYAPALAELAEEHAPPDDPVVVELRPAARLSVQVWRAGRTGPLELIVRANPYAMHGEGQPFWWYTSWLDPTWRRTPDGAGKAFFEGLPPDVPLEVEVRAEDRRLQRVGEALSLAAGEERELVIELGVGCRIDGFAAEADGGPAAGLAVWMMPAGPVPFDKYFAAKERRALRTSTVTDGTGRFVIDDVPPGVWWIGPAPRRNASAPVSGDDPAPHARRISIARDQVLAEVLLEVHRGLTIEGRVVGWNGEDTQRARIWARMQGVKVDTDRDGTFRLGPLVPGELELVGVPLFGGAFSEPVRARTGDRGVAIRLRRSGSLVGLVQGLDGAPTAAVVELVPDDPEDAGFTRRTGASLASGGFRFDRLVPGVYHLCAHDEAGQVGRLEDVVVSANAAGMTAHGGVFLFEGSSNVTVALGPGATIVARLPAQDTGPLLGFRVLQAGVEVGVAFPPTDTLHVLPGPVTVELVAYDPRTDALNTLEAHEVEAVGGHSTEVDFDYAPGG